MVSIHSHGQSTTPQGRTALIVDKPLIAQILKGSKTQHRIPTTDTATTSGFKIQQSYAVQARHDKPASCRVIIQAVTREPLDAITDDSAHAEGFATVGKFFEHWHATHPTANPTGDVWALSFVLDRSDTPMLLHRRSERGYTSDPRMAVPREPEAVDPTWLARFAEEAKDTDHARALERPIEWRLRQALADAQTAGIDVTRQVLAIEQRIRSIRLRAQQKAA